MNNKEADFEQLDFNLSELQEIEEQVEAEYPFGSSKSWYAFKLSKKAVIDSTHVSVDLEESSVLPEGSSSSYVLFNTIDWETYLIDCFGFNEKGTLINAWNVWEYANYNIFVNRKIDEEGQLKIDIYFL